MHFRFFRQLQQRDATESSPLTMVEVKVRLAFGRSASLLVGKIAKPAFPP
jgi:hypothetical protein